MESTRCSGTGLFVVALWLAAWVTPWGLATAAHCGSIELEPVEELEASATLPKAEGIAVGDGEKLRLNFKFMAGYGNDDAVRELGFEKQGRIGYVIVEIFGKLNSRLSYRVAINPVNETDPLPACGEEGYFYPNSPEFLGTIGPNFGCDPGGNRRVDMYKSIALDVLNQQGPIREAWLSFAVTNGIDLKFGRFILPMGFGWEEAGSFSAKDSTRIQRIDAEGGFGTMLTYQFKRRQGRERPVFAAHAGAVLGDGNRNKDYDYFYFDRSDLDSNSALTAFANVTFSPADSVDLRLSVKRGYSGSRVERLPNYWASKRNDHAYVASGRYRPFPYFAVFGEAVRYTWGPTRTSAEFLGFDPAPIQKEGYYAGAEILSPTFWKMQAGASFTREEISRDDSLVKYMVALGDQLVTMGKRDRGTIARFFVQFPNVKVGFYVNRDSTAFPWLSGIAPVTGATAYKGNTHKAGFVVTAGLD